MVKFKKILIVYFSGTGGTRRVANSFEEALLNRNCEVIKHSLDISEYDTYKDKYNEIINEADLIIAIYAVYALGAPKPVDIWAENLPHANKLPVVVISVSGGGEVWPNTSCRVATIKAVEKKGYEVIYEKMMVMPANIFCAVNDDLAMQIINAIPVNVNKILNDVFLEKRQRSRLKISTRILMPLTRIQKKSCWKFAENLKTNEACTGCGWCAANCPMGNIELVNNKPKFNKKCIFCLRCYYGCPNKAISNEKVKGMLLKEGFDINKVEQRMEGVEPKPVEECCKGIAWIGIKKYLLGKDR